MTAYLMNLKSKTKHMEIEVHPSFLLPVFCMTFKDVCEGKGCTKQHIMKKKKEKKEKTLKIQQQQQQTQKTKQTSSEDKTLKENPCKA